MTTETPEPPSPEEMNEWADGVVYHQLEGGRIVYFDPDLREWMPIGSRATPNGSETLAG